MATVSGITAEKAQELEDASVVSGAIDEGNGHLILTTGGGTEIDAGPARIDAGLAPIGSIMMWPTATPPAGWLLCNGGTISGTYTALIALIGSTLPDLRGRFPIGAGTGSGLTNRPLLGTGGGQTKTLAEANLPSHVHSIAHTHTMNHNHQMRYGNTDGADNANVRNAATDGTVDTGSGPIDAFSGSTGGSSAANSGTGSGSGSSFDVMNPWLALNFIIRAA